ncbi:MAG: hypothetical protein AAFQ41_09120 [Cyanobacteria bacterium J06623_7]
MSIYRGQHKSARFFVRLPLAIACLGWLAVGCEDNKLAQCEQIFQIARDVNQNSLMVNYVDRPAPVTTTSWLQAARKFDRAADNLTSLSLSHSQLIDYQNQLAMVYRIYSRATYDAVRARENSNFTDLKSARSDAMKAGAVQQKLIEQINGFCLPSQ